MTQNTFAAQPITRPDSAEKDDMLLAIILKSDAQNW